MSSINQLHTFWSYSSDNTSRPCSAVNMYLWSKGVSVTGHSEDGSLVEGRAYSYENVYELRLLQNLILNEPLLADAALVKKIFMTVSRNLLVPAEVYAESERALLDDWLSATYFVEHDEVIATSHNVALGIKVIYPKKKVVRDILSQYFPERKSRFYIAAPDMASFDEAQVSAVALLLDATCSLTLFKGKQLLHNTIFEWETPEDILYRSLDVLSELEVPREGLHFVLGGIAPEGTAVAAALQHYFEEGTYRILSPQETFKLLDTCA